MTANGGISPSSADIDDGPGPRWRSPDTRDVPSRAGRRWAHHLSSIHPITAAATGTAAGPIDVSVAAPACDEAVHIAAVVTEWRDHPDLEDPALPGARSGRRVAGAPAGIGAGSGLRGAR